MPLLTQPRLLPRGLTKSGNDFLYTFSAMASPCEVRVETDQADLALRAGIAAQSEAERIEAKYSRYRADSTLSRINASHGEPTEVDDETANVLNFAQQCFEISEGLFDITSGVLRQAWNFDGSDTLPSPAAIAAILPLVGWQQVAWRCPYLSLPPGMELDLGGLGKEYAVDRALAEVRAITSAPALVNFGGDLCVSGPRAGGRSWHVAIESVEECGALAAMLELSFGALATSGDARRFLIKNGRRYGHILNPRTGEPVDGSPRSVTVAAPSCIEAGMFATIAMLKGERAEQFLHEEGARAWCIR